MQLVKNNFVHGHWRKIRAYRNRDDWRLNRLANLYGYDGRKFRDHFGFELPDPILELPDQPNGITTAGMHYLLEVGFRSDAGSPVAQLAPWYAGLIDNSGYTGVNNSDTMSSHSGWTEITTQYDEATRQALAFAAASARAITASVSFTLNATRTIQGIFVVSNSTKGGTSGTLFSTALFGSPPGLISGNVLTANYTLTD